MGDNQKERLVILFGQPLLNILLNFVQALIVFNFNTA